MTLAVTALTDVDKNLLLRSVDIPRVLGLIDTARVICRRAAACGQHAEYQTSDLNVTRRPAAKSHVKLTTVLAAETLGQLTLKARLTGSTYNGSDVTHNRVVSPFTRTLNVCNTFQIKKEITSLLYYIDTETSVKDQSKQL